MVSLKIRRAVWERDDGICQLCREPLPFDSLMHADHIISRKLNGSDDLINLQTAHRRCNISKGDGLGHRDKRPRALLACEVCEARFMGIPKVSRYCSDHRLWDRPRRSRPAPPPTDHAAGSE